ncbi:FAD-binding oxidoreductase [Sporomusa malonica]|uniref:D-lactate dehydrogenase (cytochrome) n=1 Tax=Sporomusa malonica TaxID=112901 RepID=A0A1W2EQB7_9FIRM|nr:FAD-binding oxidoreductase [Sporomusa malonica]SMD11722.1 D-lactate dehydrogenase (cytochrome) [Sporomusa malonica]
MTTEGIQPFEARFEDYLGDESKMTGQAVSISFPETQEAVRAIVREMAGNSIPITVQGGKTGICGGAVPLSGHILNLSCMNRILGLRKTGGEYFLRVQAGVRLDELKKQLYKKSFETQGWDEESLAALAAFKQDNAYFWPPEPTETSATIGGILATNAQGICGYLYGDTRQYVEEIVLIDGRGSAITVPRGEHKIHDPEWILPASESFAVNPELLKLPQDADRIDLYLGSEGMYGIIVEATLRLTKRPREIWGVGFFAELQDNLFRFAEELRRAVYKEGTAAIAAIEYMDKTTLDHIRELKKVAAKLQGLPPVDEKYAGMIYIELHGEQEGDIETIAERLMELAGKCGCDEEFTWALSGAQDIEKMRAYRHAAPESINIALEKARRLDPKITKLSTDITMSKQNFGDLLTLYQQDAKDCGVEFAIFGHVAGNHVHVNFLPKNYEEYLAGKKLIEKWTICSAWDGGVVFSEHGVGKLKKELFQLVTDHKVLSHIRKIKNAMDPTNVLNAGNWFD